ncbi:MAG: aspartate aminotransferase family protein [Gemmatimonadetes bacterium]|nr:aspartate aminotransferase family protein [Gemmatimonadota bacterium]
MTATSPASQRTSPASGRLYQEATQYLPGGTSRIHYWFDPYPIFARSGRGCRLTDVDGVERIDFLNNMTSLIHGHAHPAINAAIRDQLERGTAFSEPTESEVALAKLIVDRVKSVERIRFGNSGTESVMLGVKLAREFTGRDKIAKFEGFYHGYYDYVQTSVRSTPANWGPAGEPATTANSGGLSSSVLGEVVTFPFNDLDAAERLLTKCGSSIACFLVDPLASQAGGPVPGSGYLDGLTQLCRKHRVVLLYDEVVSFRLASGGGQEKFGGTPDLTAFGKIIGGGLPVGAIGGRADIMALLDPSHGPPRVLSGGTFSGNPLTMTAGRVALELLTPEEFARLDRLGVRIREGVNRIFADAGEPFRMAGQGSLCRLNPTAEPVTDYRSLVQSAASPERMARLHRHLLDQGMIIARMGMACLSTPMGEAEIDDFIRAVGNAVDRLPR